MICTQLVSVYVSYSSISIDEILFRIELNCIEHALCTYRFGLKLLPNKCNEHWSLLFVT
uniref:Uncharacterized protein n=1 Tax=Anguilla anguilla TaxID=7936 RepID=A0A0E9WNF4_ANGAN